MGENISSKDYVKLKVNHLGHSKSIGNLEAETQVFMTTSPWLSSLCHSLCSLSLLAEIQKKKKKIKPLEKVDSPMQVKILLRHFQNVDAKLFGVVIHPDGLLFFFLHFCKCYYQIQQIFLQSH